MGDGREIKGQRLLIQSIDTVHRSALTHIPSQITPSALFRHPDPPPIKSMARRLHNSPPYKSSTTMLLLSDKPSPTRHTTKPESYQCPSVANNGQRRHTITETDEIT